MPFYEVQDGRITHISRVSLAAAEMKERRDVQAILRAQLAELLPDLLVIAEEFGHWDDSKRRIDLLALDRQANLVVVELKRGDTGAHMELQAVRYAAMVSTMTFEQVVETFETFRGQQEGSDARSEILAFLSWSEPNEDEFARDVRIVLFSEDYSRELTSSVLWLNEKGLDVTCFRMGAYKVGSRLLLDFQQIIPLKEAEDYQVKVRNKQQEAQSARRERVAWNGELYANYGDNEYRSWDDARKYGFISAGGGEWFSRTLRLLEPGRRVWVNRPGIGYIGVGIVTGPPIDARDFFVETEKGMRPYLEVGNVHPTMRENANDPVATDKFVPIRWIKSVPESQAVRESGLFGNQNSAAQPRAPSWPTTVARLRKAFGVVESDGGG
jgi:hypothetical protein